MQEVLKNTSLAPWISLSLSQKVIEQIAVQEQCLKNITYWLNKLINKTLTYCVMITK